MSPTDRARDLNTAHAINEREYNMLMYWYGIHYQDRKTWKADPLPYDYWYVVEGQGLLLDYYREITAAADPRGHGE